MRIVKIGASRPYEVLIGRGLLSRAGAQIANKLVPCTAALVADERVDALYGDLVAASLADAGFQALRWRFPPGENSKSLESLGRLLEFLAQGGLTRSDIVVALGGGVTGDLAGFAAAVYMRGIRFVQIPTTLLAAVDASVGGKTAVNLAAGKNLAGAFHQPELVLCDCEALKALPPELRSAGAAEAIKCGMISDPMLFDKIAECGCRRDLEEIIARCVEVKGRLVAADEHDSGERQLLNFGHTIGHALEQCSGFAMSHGHAVSMGMLAMARASERLGLCEEPCAAPLERALHACGLPLSSPYSARELFEAALSDKKRRGGEITLVLPLRVGKCLLHKIPLRELYDFIRIGLEVCP